MKDVESLHSSSESMKLEVFAAKQWSTKHGQVIQRLKDSVTQQQQFIKSMEDEVAQDKHVRLLKSKVTVGRAPNSRQNRLKVKTEVSFLDCSGLLSLHVCLL